MKDTWQINNLKAKNMPCHSLIFFGLSLPSFPLSAVSTLHTKETVAVGTDVAVSVVARALTPSRLARSVSGARNGGPPMSLRWSKTR